MKTEQEINAEKAAKPRPDLLPARALEQIMRAYDEVDNEHADPDCDHNITTAHCALVKFRQTCEVRYLELAAAWVAFVLDGIPEACMAGGRVMGYGFRKHGNCTWRVAGTEQADPQTHVASAERHLLEYLIDPEAREDGSGLPVLEHAFSQLAITIDLVLDPPVELGRNDGRGTVTARLAKTAPDPWALPEGLSWQPTSIMGWLIVGRPLPLGDPLWNLIDRRDVEDPCPGFRE